MNTRKRMLLYQNNNKEGIQEKEVGITGGGWCNKELYIISDTVMTQSEIYPFFLYLKCTAK